MIEQGEVLATWQLLADPMPRPEREIPARRIGAHRKAYLEYEGPVSGGRGHVRRVAAGTCEVSEAGDQRWRMKLHGGDWVGKFELVRCFNSEWELRCIAE
jgi:hypothetical protein